VVRPSVGVDAPPGAACWGRYADTVSVAAGRVMLGPSPRGRCSSTRPHLCLPETTRSVAATPTLIYQRRELFPRRCCGAGQSLGRFRAARGLRLGRRRMPCASPYGRPRHPAQISPGLHGRPSGQRCALGWRARTETMPTAACGPALAVRGQEALRPPPCLRFQQLGYPW